MIRILGTGSRVWTNYQAIKDALVVAIREAGGPVFEEVIAVHGGAPGFDTMFGEIALELGCEVEVHKADWENEGQRAGPRRNERMVARGAVACIAGPLGVSRGPRHCMRIAAKAGIPVTVIELRR